VVFLCFSAIITQVIALATGLWTSYGEEEIEKENVYFFLSIHGVWRTAINAYSFNIPKQMIKRGKFWSGGLMIAPCSFQVLV
jgi:hypothetical protein